MLLPRGPVRPGLSLMEVLVALAIFLLSMVALGQLFSFGSDRAADVRDTSRAPVLAQSKLAEVSAGIVPLSSSTETPFENDDSDWNWSLDANADSAIPNLWRVTVTVSKQRGPSDRYEYQLSAMVLAPSVRNAPPSSGSSSSSGTTTSGGQ